MNMLLTGATGLVGRATVPALAAAGHTVRAAVRARCDTPAAASQAVVGEIGPDTAWDTALASIDVVVHLAARVHQMNDAAEDPLAEYRRVNTFGTERLARDAARCGVRRLVFVSSAKVGADSTTAGSVLDERLPPRPQGPYAQSKWEAEQVLQRVAQETGLEVVILRPPLVYGPGVGANFASLIGLLRGRWPLPVGAIANRRSFIYSGNLASAILVSATHPAAAGRTYYVSDGEDMSTPRLVRHLGQALGRRPCLLPVPATLLRLAGALTGNAAAIERLVESFAVDASLIGRELGWTPPWRMEQGLAQTVAPAAR